MPDSLAGLVALLTTPDGIAAVLGVILSYIPEYVPSWGDVAPRWKRLTIAGASLAIGVVAVVVQAQMHGVPVDAEVLYRGVRAGALALATSQMAHLRLLPAPSGDGRG